MSNNIYEKHSVSKIFFKFAVPSILGLLIVSLQIMIDGIFVGRYIGPEGLASVNISMPYINLIMGVSLMISIGGGVIASIHLGNKDSKKASEVASFTLLITFIVLTLIAVFSCIFIDEIINILGANESLFHLTKLYLLPIVFYSFIYNFIIYTETFVRIGGKPNAMFLSGLIAFLANIFLDYFLIEVFKFGMVGASYATVFANFIGSIALLPYFFKNRCVIQFVKPKGSLKLLKNIFYNGSSEMFSILAGAVAIFLFNRVVMESIGELGVSALTIVFYVNGIVNITLFGLSQALQPIVSYNLGARKITEISKVLKISMITGGALGLTAFIFMKIFDFYLINLFTKGDVELNNLALEATKYIIYSYLISFANIIASSFHTAIEKPMESAGIAVLRSLVFIAIFLFTLPHYIGITGVWLAIPMAELSSLVVSLYLMKSSYKEINRKFAMA